VVVGVFAGVALGACDDNTVSELPELTAMWGPSTGFVMSGQDRARLPTESNLWVVGPGVSAALYLPPELLVGSDSRGFPRSFPDVIIPQNIVPGTRLEIRRVKDGALVDAVADLVIISGDPAATVPYTTVQSGTQKQCAQTCWDNGTCDICRPCGNNSCIGLKALGGGSPSYANSAKCNGTSPHAPCGGGSMHACWTFSWTVTCGP
jgi:hypothetical protein